MEYVRLGSSGLKISSVGLGGNNFGWWSDRETSAAVVKRALELGVNYIDTADIYDKGNSESFIGDALKGMRHEVILATKFGAPMGTAPNQTGGSRYYIMRAVEDSLKRLQTDYIDLYQIHRPDPDTPIEETLRALDDLVRSGKVRYVGCSNFAAWQLDDALWTAASAGLSPFITLQARYNLLERSLEAETVPCCEAHGVGLIPWGPLAGGFLTGKYLEGKTAPSGTRLSKPMGLYDGLMTPQNYARVVRLGKFAADSGHEMGDLALAWLLANPSVCCVIPGARLPQQMDLNVRAADWQLTPEDMAQIEELLAVS